MISRFSEGAIWLIAAVLAVTAGCGGGGGGGGGGGRADKEAELKTNSGAAGMSNQAGRQNPECVGRFEFQAPAGVVLAGRSQSIYGVDVMTEPVSGGLQSLWDQRVAKVRAAAPPPGAMNTVMRSFELLSGAPAIWYHRNSTAPELAALLAARQFGDHALVVNAAAELNSSLRQKVLNGGSEEIIERLVANVIGQYRPGERRGFCAGYGAILGKPSKYEIAGARLERVPSTNDWQMSFHTETASETNRPTGPDLEDEQITAKQRGDSLEVLNQGSRVAAGLEGRELAIRVRPASGGAPLVRFTWFFTGERGRADRPSIQVRLGAAAANLDAAKRDWDAVLNSLRPVRID